MICRRSDLRIAMSDHIPHRTRAALTPLDLLLKITEVVGG
jgi:hypothetical protein